MFTLKHLANLNNLPDVLRTEIFEKLFFKAEIAKLSKEDRKEYNQSLKRYRDMNLAIRDRDLIIRDRDQIIRDREKIIRDREKIIRDRDLRIMILSKDNSAKDQKIVELERMLRINKTVQ